MDLAARVHALEKELHTVRKESRAHAAARKVCVVYAGAVFVCTCMVWCSVCVLCYSSL